jgi:glycosidase
LFPDPLANLDPDADGNPHDDGFFYAVFAPTMSDFNFNDPISRAELVDELAGGIAFWIQHTGVNGFRCDADRYLVKNGTSSNQRKDQPETHAIWVATQLGGDFSKEQAAASLYLLLSGNQAVYYGEEIGMTGGGNDPALRQPMDFAAATV